MPLHSFLPFSLAQFQGMTLPLPASQLILIAILVVSTILYVTQWISIELTSMLDHRGAARHRRAATR